MTGSACDGEDVVQETLMRGFYRFSELREGTSLRSWLFRIAHNRCVDFLRRRGRFVAEEDVATDTALDDELDRKQRADRALANAVTELPPKERACLILKDVLDCSLEETAEITESNVGAVKAALHRGREKLERAELAPQKMRALPPEQRAVIERYLTAFNARDWDGVRALLTADARLELVAPFEGLFRNTTYLTNYGRLPTNWKLALAVVDGVESVVHFREIDGRWRPRSVIQFGIAGDKVALVRDYVHAEYMLQHSDVQETYPDG
jgi:RNA polymerase sigma-70 factor (ECF subfamily)